MATKPSAWSAFFLQEIGRQFRDHGADVFHRELALAGHHRGVGQHVPIVRDVDVDETLRRSDDFPVALIGCDRLEVGIDRLLPAAAANVDVRRHMDVVSQARLQSPESIGGGARTLRMRRGFGRVDVEMVRERMFRIQLQDRVERGENFLGARVRLAFRRPLVPRPQIHHRLGKKDADLGIVRVSLPNLAHRVRVSLVERRAIFRLRIGITLTERFDQGALHRRGVFGVLLGKLQFRPGQLSGRRRDERTD